MRPTARAVVWPSGLVATLRVTYTDDDEGTIIYAKAQLSSDLDVELRRFAAADPRFPNYSTGDQFLTNEQFRNLVELGRRAAEQSLAALRTAQTAPTSG